MIELIAVGADPELFFMREDGTPLSSEGLVGGTKEAPRAIPNLPEGYAVQEDNVAVEFNIPAARGEVEFSNSIAKAIAYINALAKKQKLTLSYESALHFPLEQLRTVHAARLGCDPDYNAWTCMMNPRPVPPASLRTAAGHVHVSWAGAIVPDDQLAIVKGLDLMLTVPSLLATPKPREGTNRRALYGQAGAFRPKPYGVEHRSLDNFWIKDADNRKHVFKTVRNCVDWLNGARNDARVELENWGQEIQDCINTHDKQKAIHIMDYFSLPDFPVRVAA